MTEYEMVDLLQGWFSMMAESATMYFTVISAYIAVAYIVGNKLSKPQLLIISGLFVIWAGGTMTSVYSFLVNGIQLEARIYELSSETLHLNDSTRLAVSASSFLVIQLVGILASLYFMWSVRHPRTE